MNRAMEQYLLNPPPGSKAAEAKEFGIDLTLLIKNLRLTPHERVENLQSMMRSLHKFSHDAEKWRKRQRGGIGTGPKVVG
jgi:hypothetical protein